ncbi:Pex19 protein family-domain-containing protein [Chaetomium fimeti]|uniref:Pex19 protein family-domain-containing protein n=1 Tax=Chaetomium fimeti TaxID=1854472 RepID=A0AAE0LTC3_9PEZI|nr:Pex19 protein family-domain-containing protein [Chaetomium fimeti]
MRRDGQCFLDPAYGGLHQTNKAPFPTGRHEPAGPRWWGSGFGTCKSQAWDATFSPETRRSGPVPLLFAYPNFIATLLPKYLQRGVSTSVHTHSFTPPHSPHPTLQDCHFATMASTAGDIGAPVKDVESHAPAVAKTEPTNAATVEDVDDDVPDPDEDDLDDLDDMLDEFSAVKVDATKPEVPPGPTKPPAAAAAQVDEEEEGMDEEFAKQLQAGMADLLGGLEDSSEMQAQFESIFKELGASASASADKASTDPAPPTASAGPSTAGPNNTDASFQETIRRTMERMQTSGDQATAAATAEGPEDLLAELMKQMQGAGADGGEGGEEEFSKMLMGMMDQLTTKEILYEPMKELDDKFPEWLQKNREKTSAEELKRYEEQQKLVKEIVLKFEEPGYSDSHKAHREYIVDRMQQMQASGSPPPDLVGDMPSAQDAFNMPDESCNPQ